MPTVRSTPSPLLLPGRGKVLVVDDSSAMRRALGLLHPASEVEEVVTISLGLASMRPMTGGSAQDMVLRADQQLYRAKSEGRNRACG